MKLETIYGAADAANIASCKVLMKAGLSFIEEFEDEGHRCNWYQLNRADWTK